MPGLALEVGDGSSLDGVAGVPIVGLGSVLDGDALGVPVGVGVLVSGGVVGGDEVAGVVGVAGAVLGDCAGADEGAGVGDPVEDLPGAGVAQVVLDCAGVEGAADGTTPTPRVPGDEVALFTERLTTPVPPFEVAQPEPVEADVRGHGPRLDVVPRDARTCCEPAELAGLPLTPAALPGPPEVYPMPGWMTALPPASTEELAWTSADRRGGTARAKAATDATVARPVIMLSTARLRVRKTVLSKDMGLSRGSAPTRAMSPLRPSSPLRPLMAMAPLNATK